MDVSKLTRDRDAIRNGLKAQGDAYVVAKPTTVHFPVRYVSRGMGEVGEITRICGFFCIIQDDRYSVLSHLAPVRTDPDSKSVVTIDGTDYYKFDYEVGSKLIYDVNTIQVNTLVYPIFNELIARAVIPWYATPADEAKVFITAARAAGARIVDDNAIIEMMIAMGTRQPKDKSLFYRHIAKDLNDPKLKDYSRVPLRSPIYGANNATALLIGARFDDSITTALNNPTENIERVEQLLRS